MDYKEIFERLGATLNVEKQAWAMVPLNSKTIREQIKDYLTKKYDVEEKKRGRKIKNIIVGPISCSFELPPFCYDSKETNDIERLYVNELKSIEVGKDPEHPSKDVVFEEGGANKVEEKKRGRKIKNIRVGPISCSFELPSFCYDPKETNDIERILSTLPKDHIEENDGAITPLESRTFFVAERANNWTMEISKRDNNRLQDVYSTHIPSNRNFRSKPEVIQFILHETPPKTKSEKRKSAKPASG